MCSLPGTGSGAVTVILLVRHGQTAWNLEERFRGQVDLPLDDVGVRQAEAVGQRLTGGWQPVAIYASPLQRTLRTADAIALACGLRTTIHPGLLDINYGALAGLTLKEAAKQHSGLTRAWQQAPHTVHFPDGESLADTRGRAEAALSEIVTRHPGHAVVLVTHVVVCRLLLCSLLGLDNSHFWQLQPATASLSVFEISEGRSTLLSVNDTCHLASIGGGV
ncbi:MAG: histidine phosphatase family protein [Anaerolineales bacterium]|nr:MAG: histidine phosphatase family protein [Anaerolineales bacterium]